MKEYFQSNYGTHFLFKEWKITTWQELVITLLLVMSLTISSEACKAYQTFLAFSLHLSRPNQHSDVALTKKRRILRHILATIIYILQICLSYTVMLCIMMYQIYIIVVVIIGIGIGYFLSQPLILKHMRVLYTKVNHVEWKSRQSDDIFLMESRLLHGNAIQSKEKDNEKHNDDCYDDKTYMLASRNHDVYITNDLDLK